MLSIKPKELSDNINEIIFSHIIYNDNNNK